ncbi:MAG: hypothetical protein QOH13_2275 [Thermoleophilaceae bacterium]|nr:hypothetical protein [Thermoleophilaceae bacterium]
MSTRTARGIVAAAGMALALSATAYADPGKSPNGPPGPAGNPNQPAAQPQAAPPEAPAAGGQGEASNGKSDSAPGHNKTQSAEGKSQAPHGKSQAAHGKSGSHAAKPRTNQATPSPGTPRKGGRADRPAGKITICHATKSVKNPYVEITISVNGLHGHGPAADPRHHEGSWQDIIPAPAGGCPGTVNQPGVTGGEKPTEEPTKLPTEGPVAGFVAPQPEVAATAPASQAVLGVQVHGTSPATAVAPAAGVAPAKDGNAVLGENASGSSSPKAAAAPASVRAVRHASGTLPFTGFQLAFMLLAAAIALIAGVALRRVSATRS